MNGTVTIYLYRQRQSDLGTEGRLSVPGLQFTCPCLELPWRDNRPRVSCIPAGTYPVAWRESVKWKAFHIQNVPGRSWILIHSGNFAGDVSKGWKTHVQGCVILGRKFGVLNGQRAILVSRSTVKRFNAALRGRKARVTIIDEWRQHA